MNTRTATLLAILAAAGGYLVGSSRSENGAVVRAYSDELREMNVELARERAIRIAVDAACRVAYEDYAGIVAPVVPVEE